MSLLPNFEFYTSGWLEVLTDASLLTLFSSPLIYSWSLAPLRGDQEVTIWGLTPALKSVRDAVDWSVHGRRNDLSLGIVVALFGIGIFSIESAIMLIIQLINVEATQFQPLLDATLICLASTPLLYLLLRQYAASGEDDKPLWDSTLRRFLRLFIPLFVLVTGLGLLMLASELEQRRSDQVQTNLGLLEHVGQDINTLIQEAAATLLTLRQHPRLTGLIDEHREFRILSDFDDLLRIGKRYSRICYYRINGNPEFCLQVDPPETRQLEMAPGPLSVGELQLLQSAEVRLFPPEDSVNRGNNLALRLGTTVADAEGNSPGFLMLELRGAGLAERLLQHNTGHTGTVLLITPRGTLLSAPNSALSSTPGPTELLTKTALDSGFSSRITRRENETFLSRRALTQVQQPTLEQTTQGWGIAVYSPSIWNDPTLRHFISNLMLLLIFITPLLAGGCGVLAQAQMARRLANRSLWKKQNQLMETIHAMEQEIEARERAERQLDLADEVFQSTAEGITVTDPDGNICSVNPAFSQITGYSREEAVGNNLRMLSSGRQERMFYQNLWSCLTTSGRWQGEILNRKKDGTIYPQQGSITCVRNNNGNIRHYIYIFSDVSELRNSTHSLERMMHYDHLTGLPNRLLLIDRLRRACVRSKVTEHSTGILHIDLYLFKRINDTFGFDAGDEVIKQLSQRLESIQPPESTLARLRDDEFVLVLDQVRGSEDLKRFSEKIFSTISETLTIQGQKMKLASNIGITLFPKDSSGESELINNAGTALIKAKKRGPNQYEFFTEEMSHDSSRQLAMENNLRRAIEEREFTLHYQPQVSVLDGTIIGAEALLRWRDSVSGRMISPSEFIPFAEQSGLIIPLGEWILKTACEQIAAWERQGFGDLRVAVNLSPIQFRNGNIVKTVRDCLEATGINPRQLDIELTEGAIMDEAFNASRRVSELHDLGVVLSIDDFGTGYSSLSYLKRFPIHMLKIDRSFIHSIQRDHADLAITESINQLGKNLGKLVIAEGVENWAQFDMLRTLGCDMIQGFLFSKPLPVDALTELLQRSAQNRLSWTNRICWRQPYPGQDAQPNVMR
jgi:diguanylate cyclase (GGDEF)-like protein/PAS domain S-box-containing protein